jgi:hypothetical protein
MMAAEECGYHWHTFYSHVGNYLFPAWENFVPMQGTFSLSQTTRAKLLRALLFLKRAQASKLGGLEHYQGLRRKVVNLNQGTTNGLESVDIIIL